MSLQKKLKAFFSEIVKEAEANPQFAVQLEQVRDLSPKLKVASKSEQPGARRNRRAPAVLNPFDEYKKGEAALRDGLSALNLEQLRDLVAQYGMDGSKLAMKWKDQ